MKCQQTETRNGYRKLNTEPKRIFSGINWKSFAWKGEIYKLPINVLRKDGARVNLFTLTVTV